MNNKARAKLLRKAADIIESLDSPKRIRKIEWLEVIDGARPSGAGIVMYTEDATDDEPIIYNTPNGAGEQ